MSHIILIDGKNQLYRMHYSPVLTHLSTEDGFPTGAIFGCLNYSLLAVAKRIPDASFIWCWDGQGETWRHKMMMELPKIDQTYNEIEEIEDDITEQEIVSGATPMIEDFTKKMLSTSLGYFGTYNQPQKKKKKHLGYKAQRQKPVAKNKKDKYPTDEKSRAIIQIPILKLIMETAGIRQFEVQGLECDDLIGIMTKRIMNADPEAEITILSGDRDFYQLLRYPQVTVAKSVRGGNLDKVTADQVKQEYGVKPKHWAKYRALTGDSSDNIPHLWKVGPATAKKMLHDGIDPSQSKPDEIKDDVKAKYARYFQPHGIEKMWEAVYGNYQLCKLVTDPYDELLPREVREELRKTLEDLKEINDFQRRKEGKTPEAYRKVSFLLAKYELNSIIARRDLLWSIP